MTKEKFKVKRDKKIIKSTFPSLPRLPWKKPDCSFASSYQLVITSCV